MRKEDLLRSMGEAAEQADHLRAEARRLLTGAVRSGLSAGLSQREIAAAISRSQPEVSRLGRFHGTTPISHELMRNRSELMNVIKAAGGRNARVFGSVARGDDTPDSDIDLLVDLPQGTSLFSLSRLERELSAILGHPVDVVPADKLKPHLSERVFEEAVPL